MTIKGCASLYPATVVIRHTKQHIHKSSYKAGKLNDLIPARTFRGDVLKFRVIEIKRSEILQKKIVHQSHEIMRHLREGREPICGIIHRY